MAHFAAAAVLVSCRTGLMTIKQVWYDKDGRKHTRKVGSKGIEETVESEADSSKNTNGDHWYKKPVGIVTLTVAGGLILWATTKLLGHYFGISN